MRHVNNSDCQPGARRDGKSGRSPTVVVAAARLRLDFSHKPLNQAVGSIFAELLTRLLVVSEGAGNCRACHTAFYDSSTFDHGVVDRRP
jgi:hypothetical protein